MTEQTNLDTARQIYAAFGRGDIPAILARLAPGVEFELSAPPGKVPFGGCFQGREGVTRFFTLLGQSEALEQFEPREFIAQGDNVVALGHLRARVPATGRVFETDWAQVFTFKNGQVVHFREFSDTAATVAAFGNGNSHHATGDAR